MFFHQNKVNQKLKKRRYGKFKNILILNDMPLMTNKKEKFTKEIRKSFNLIKNTTYENVCNAA